MIGPLPPSIGLSARRISRFRSSASAAEITISSTHDTEICSRASLLAATQFRGTCRPSNIIVSPVHGVRRMVAFQVDASRWERLVRAYCNTGSRSAQITQKSNLCACVKVQIVWWLSTSVIVYWLHVGSLPRPALLCVAMIIPLLV